jgi:hypothetical protein
MPRTVCTVILLVLARSVAAADDVSNRCLGVGRAASAAAPTCAATAHGSPMQLDMLIVNSILSIIVRNSRTRLCCAVMQHHQQLAQQQQLLLHGESSEASAMTPPEHQQSQSLWRNLQVEPGHSRLEHLPSSASPLQASQQPQPSSSSKQPLNRPKRCPEACYSRATCNEDLGRWAGSLAAECSTMHEVKYSTQQVQRAPASST